jgi:ABC-type Fe3+/spermidine/putrescine transport system ATPase subunit
MSTGIKIENIEKSFGTNPVLKGINLEVPSGQLVSILGSSGCGKTTLLRIVAGLERATSGHVYFGDELQDQITVEKRAIAMVFQKALLFPSMTIGENVAFSLRASKNPPKDIDKRVEEMLELVKLPGFASRRPGEVKFSVDVNLPKPRYDHDVRSSPEFLELRARLWDALREDMREASR